MIVPMERARRPWVLEAPTPAPSAAPTTTAPTPAYIERQIDHDSGTRDALDASLTLCLFPRASNVMSLMNRYLTHAHPAKQRRRTATAMRRRGTVVPSRCH